MSLSQICFNRTEVDSFYYNNIDVLTDTELTLLYVLTGVILCVAGLLLLPSFLCMTMRGRYYLQSICTPEGFEVYNNNIVLQIFSIAFGFTTLVLAYLCGFFAIYALNNRLIKIPVYLSGVISVSYIFCGLLYILVLRSTQRKYFNIANVKRFLAGSLCVGIVLGIVCITGMVIDLTN